MMRAIREQVTLSRPPEGPIAAQIWPFLQSMEAFGYSPLTLQRYARIVASFSRWLQCNKVSIRSIGPDQVDRFLRYRSLHAGLWPSSHAALRHLLVFLRQQGLLAASKPSSQRTTPAERRATEYERYLRDVRALADVTIEDRLRFVREFLTSRFGAGEANLSQLSADDVTTFIRKRVAKLSVGRAKHLNGSLRGFLRDSYSNGELNVNLADAVPTVASWAFSSIPKAITPDITRRLLKSVDRSTAAGLRNYAILLLLARLGMRAGEVARLELDDLDWRAGKIIVRATNGGRVHELPMPHSVGTAIAAYLQHGRPRSTCRRVFLRLIAPITGFSGSSPVGYTVLAALRRAGMQAPTHGAHQFRHGLATELLRRGASLSEVGQLLGHRNPDTTRIYAKVDIKALRSLALPWPGGLR